MSRIDGEVVGEEGIKIQDGVAVEARRRRRRPGTRRVPVVQNHLRLEMRAALASSQLEEALGVEE
jgi:hypothetical protein